jgi:hypothetical protein
MAEALEDAVEAKDKRVALIIAILALFLALSEAGGKNAEHRSTEKNIESSDLYNFYQAKKIRSGMIETDIAQMEVSRQVAADPAAQARAKEAAEARELSNHRLEHFEYASGLIQIAIVLASAAIITGIGTLMWLSLGLGAIGAVLMAFGYFAPTVLGFLG